MKCSKVFNIIATVTVIIFITNKTVAQNTIMDTLYNYDPAELSNSFFPLLDWELDAAFYFEIDTASTYDINEIQFQFISDFQFWWGHQLPYTFPLTIRIGSLDTIPYNGMELWPTQNTGNPYIDIWSALPGEEIVSIDVTINDSTELYPNWKILELDTIAALKNLTGNFWITANVVLFRTLWDSIIPSTCHSFSNHDNGFWVTHNFTPDRAIIIIIEKDYANTVEYLSPNPRVFELHQNYPNPFNSTTKIPYTIFLPSEITFIIYNSLGKEIYSISNLNHVQGNHFVEWKGIDSFGKEVPSGIYFYNLRAQSNQISYSKSGKLLFLK